MRNRKVDLCPRCGSEMKIMPGSDRTVPGGIWFISQCPRCLHRVDVFRPRRKARR